MKSLLTLALILSTVVVNAKAAYNYNDICNLNVEIQIYDEGSREVAMVLKDSLKSSVSRDHHLRIINLVAEAKRLGRANPYPFKDPTILTFPQNKINSAACVNATKETLGDMGFDLTKIRTYQISGVENKIEVRIPVRTYLFNLPQ